jgi:hypothetical protein
VNKLGTTVALKIDTVYAGEGKLSHHDTNAPLSRLLRYMAGKSFQKERKGKEREGESEKED